MMYSSMDAHQERSKGKDGKEKRPFHCPHSEGFSFFICILPVLIHLSVGGALIHVDL